MSRSSVLGAAAALNEFTAAQIAAYCEDDQDGVLDVLQEHADLFEPVPQARSPRWRVTDRRRLRETIAAAETGTPRTPPPRPDPGEAGRVRLLLAEQTLLACADEPSAASRRTMAATATNYLRQFLADLPDLGERPRWWEIGPACVDELGDRLATGAVPVSPARLRTDFALASLTGSEAASEDVSIGFLIDTATGLSRLMSTREAGQEGVQRLSRRFADLAMKLTTPSMAEAPEETAPARLLSALAWRRAGPAAQGGWEPAARAQVTLLRTIADHHPLAPPEGSGCLYRVLGDAGHGRQRVAVYRDLLELLPSRYACEPVEELLPGVVVTAEADPRAGRLLSGYAGVIEEDLRTSPYGSERALVGQVAHRFEEFADAPANGDRGVADRTTRTRRELLALFDVGV